MTSLNPRRFKTGVKYTLTIALILQVIGMIIWLVIYWNLSLYPFMLVNLGIGGLAFIIAGILGPGRYKQQFPFVLYTPRDGGSYSKYFKVSGYTVDPEVKSVEIVINGTVYDHIEFRDDFTFEKVFQQKDILDGEVNFIWLRSGDKVSNRSLMTFYDPEDFDPEEVEAIEKDEFDFENRRTIQEARELYLKDRGGNTGSLSLGIMASGLLLIFSSFVTSWLASLI